MTVSHFHRARRDRLNCATVQGRSRRSFPILRIVIGAAPLAGPIAAQPAPPALVRWADKPLQRETAYAAAEYDQGRGRAVLFGGCQGGALVHNSNETWEWDGMRWLYREPTARPPIATLPLGQRTPMAHDVARRRTVVLTPTGTGLATWEWDGAEWILRTPATSPSQADEMVYDATRQRTVMVAQVQPSGSQTWEWNGSDWTRMATAASPPSAGPMTYDLQRQRVVLVTAVEQQTWEWDGTVWVNRGGGPGASAFEYRLAYDAARGRAVLAGGGLSPIMDVWEWDGSIWTRGLPATNLPVREGHALWYDPALRRVVLFGGMISPGFAQPGPFQNDLWAWDGNDWVLLGMAGPPTDQYAMSFDTARGLAVLYGGALRSTWEWDGVAWNQRAPITSPSPRWGQALAHDSPRQRTVLFGGSANLLLKHADTWEWDGTDWAQRFPAQSPPPRCNHALAGDAARGRVVLFGGADASALMMDTWEWDGSAWTERFPATSPSERDRHAMAYDAARRRVVLFGGSHDIWLKSDTWEWDGNNWVERFPATVPPARDRHAMAYDAARQRVVLFGGQGGTAALGDTWEWDGVDWRQTQPVASRPSGPLAYDSARNRTVLFAGSATWVLGETVSASAKRYGAGCYGSIGLPTLTSLGRPSLGNAAFALELVAARPRAPVSMLLSPTSTAIPLGASCTLLVTTGELAVGLPLLASASGVGRTPLPIPFLQTLVGVRFHAQAVIVDPVGPWYGMALSQGVQLIVGD